MGWRCLLAFVVVLLAGACDWTAGGAGTLGDTSTVDLRSDQASGQRDGAADDGAGQGPCVANCEGRQCGDDGCGALCGVCEAGIPCLPDGLCMQPGSCAHAERVADGCPSGHTLVAGMADPVAFCCAPRSCCTEGTLDAGDMCRVGGYAFDSADEYDCGGQCGGDFCIQGYAGSDCGEEGWSDAGCIDNDGKPLEGVFVSEDGGVSFKPANVGLPFESETSVVLDQRGEDWYRTDMLDLQMAPWDPDTMFLATWDGLHHSLDGGKTWTAVASEPIRSLVIHPTQKTLYAVNVHQIDGAQLLTSIDLGYNWSRRNIAHPDAVASEMPITTVDTLLVNPKNANSLLVSGYFRPEFYASMDATNLLGSSDGGATWQVRGVPTADSAADVQVLLRVPTDPDRIMAWMGSDLTAYESTDEGVTWRALAENELGYDGVVRWDPYRPGRVFRSQGGVWKYSMDQGLTWTTFGAQDDYPMGALLLAPDDVAYTYWSGCPWSVETLGYLGRPEACGGGFDLVDNRMLARSGDGGFHWTPAAGGLPSVEENWDTYCVATRIVVVDPRNPNRIFVLVTVDQRSGPISMKEDC